MDKRLGYYNDDGSVRAWPQTTVGGATYDRLTQPPMTRRISGNRFVVLDVHPFPEREAIIAELDAAGQSPTLVKVSREKTEASA
jgi:hypothetical protein